MSPWLSIALNTYRELIRSKVLYLALFFAVALVALSVFFGSVSIGDRIKVIKDFGLFGISFIAVGFTVISGSALLSKELQRKTVYNILSKPVARWEFLLGKYAGMLFTSAVLIFSMITGLALFVWALEGQFDNLLFTAALFMLFELVIITAVGLLFSSIVVTPLLAGLFTFGVFLSGRAIGYLSELKKLSSSELMAGVLDTLSLLLPNLDQLNIINSVAYGKIVSLERLIYAAGYSLSYAVVCLALASTIFMRRDFN